ncbi:MAG TPA: hypothetical protein VME22_19380 [Solirubrobacteraceae bacterium]|nr:hypothetical protein [Solirubrobacteraceae bacterium]
MEELSALDPAALKAAREVSDRREKRLDQLTARVSVAAFGSDDQVPFFSPSESSPLQRDPPVRESSEFSQAAWVGLSAAY